MCMAAKTAEEKRRTTTIVIVVVAVSLALFVFGSFFVLLVGLVAVFGEPLEEGNVAVIEVKGAITGDGSGGPFTAGASSTTAFRRSAVSYPSTRRAARRAPTRIPPQA